MSETTNFRYTCVPLYVLREVFLDSHKGISNLFDVGIYRSSETLKVSLEAALTQLMYCYYRHPDDLTPSLKSQLEEMIDDEIITLDEDYNGFFGSTFEPFDVLPPKESEEIIAHIQKNQPLVDEILEFHRLRQTKKVLHMKYSIEKIIRCHAEMKAKYNNFEKAPLFSLKVDLLFEYYKQEKSEFQIAAFAMFAGIKSLLGQKKHIGTTRNMILCRMFGASNPTMLTAVLKNPKIKKAYDKYSKRYHFEKVLEYLLDQNFLSARLGFHRRTYLSCTLTPKELADEVVAKNNKRKLRKNKESEMRDYIKRQLAS